MSFALCGSTDHRYRKSDWIKTPSCFKNIIEAISESGLRDSLQQVDIDWNETLKKDEVEAMFNRIGMPHISVVEEGPFPMR